MAASYKTEAELERDILSFFALDGADAMKDLISRGLWLPRVPHASSTMVMSQVCLDEYGRCDLLIVNTGIRKGIRYVSIDIIELKNESLTTAHIGQVSRYGVAALETLKVLFPNEATTTSETRYEVLTRMHLIGTSYDNIINSDANYIVQCIPNCLIYSFSVCPFSGLRFSRMGKYRANIRPETSKGIRASALKLLSDDAQFRRINHAASIRKL